MIFEEQFPVPRYTAASKIGNSVISLLWQLRCRCNPDHNKFSSSSNTTVVAIFPKLCLWRRSLCSNLGGIDHEKLHRATLTESDKHTLTQNRAMNSLYYFNKRSLFWMSLINFNWSLVFSLYLYRAFNFCLLVSKILAHEAIRSVMHSAQDTTLKITIKTIYLTRSAKYAGPRHRCSSLTYISLADIPYQNSRKSSNLPLLPLWMKLNTNYTFYSIVICTIVFDLRLLANGRDNSQYCCPTMLGFVASVLHLAKGLSDFKLCAATHKYKQQHATDATCSIQQCWEFLAKNVASVCTGLDFYSNKQ